MKKVLLLIYLTFAFPVGEAGAIFLLIAPGASAAGTGEAQVAKANDAYASYYNPAGLAFQNTPGMAGMHVNWLPNLADDLYYEFLAYKQPMNNMDGTIGGHLIYLNLGEQMGMDEMGNETGQFKSYMWALALGYGTRISKTSSIGVNFKVFHQKLADSGTGSEQGDPYSTDFAFDLGYLKKFGVLDGAGKKWYQGPLHLGFSILNIGPEIDFVDADQADPAPTNLKFGLYKEFHINDYNKVTLLLDINRLMVARYPAMDWDGDGFLQNDGVERGYTDPWYKAIVTCWLDDWYYKYDRDYDGDNQIGGQEQVLGEFRAFQTIFEQSVEVGELVYNSGDLELYGYAEGVPCTAQSNGYCDQYNTIYNNGYNFTSIEYLDSGDDFDDANNDGYWNPPEPFYDLGNGTFEDFNGYTDSISDYQSIIQDDGTTWIYYNTFDAPGAIVQVEVDNDGNITGIDYGNGSRDNSEDYIDWNGDNTYDVGEEWENDNNGNGTFDMGYSATNDQGTKEVGSGEDYTFADELKELIANFGLEYWYTDSFVLRAGYIYDKEGKIMNPTFGAGIRFGQYGFDFGYTAGDQDHARANTMFFSVSMEL